MTEEKDPTERVNMNWPVGLKARVQEYAGPRGLTDFTVGAVETRLKDEDRVVVLEKEVDELHYLVQLIADRYVIGGETDDREAFLMEVDLPSWVSTHGWPERFAKQVQQKHLPVAPAHVPAPPPAPITGIRDVPDLSFHADEPDALEQAQEEMVEATSSQDDDLHTPMFLTGPPKVGKSPMPVSPAVREAMGDVMINPGGSEFLDRVQKAAAEKGIDIGGAGLRSASTLPVPEKPNVNVHNHAWSPDLICECGAFIDKSEPDKYPNGIVREGGPVTEHESAEAFVEHLETVAAPPEPVTTVEDPTPTATRSLDNFEVDF